MRSVVFCPVIAVTLLSACAPVQTGNPTSGKSQEQIVAAIGRNDVAGLIVPGSDGVAADAITKGLGKTLGEASLPRSIRLGLADVKQRGMRAYVGGESAGKTEWALSEALLNSAPGSLSGVIIYTNIHISPKLRNAAGHAGAQLVQAGA